MVVNFTRINGIGIVHISKVLTDATVNSFRDQFSSWQEGERNIINFVINLEKVDFMDSAGIGTLIAVLKRVTECGGDIKIACLQKKPRMVFEITRAYKIFEIYETVEDALEGFD